MNPFRSQWRRLRQTQAPAQRRLARDCVAGLPPGVEAAGERTHMRESFVLELARDDRGARIVRTVAIDHDFPDGAELQFLDVLDVNAARNPARPRTTLRRAHVQDREIR